MTEMTARSRASLRAEPHRAGGAHTAGAPPRPACCAFAPSLRRGGWREGRRPRRGPGLPGSVAGGASKAGAARQALRSGDFPPWDGRAEVTPREAGTRSGGSRWAPSALLLEGPSPRAPCGQGRLTLAAARRDSTTLALTARTEARREARLREVRGHPRGVAHRDVSRARMPVLVRSAPRPTSPSGHFLPFAPCSDAARGRPGSAAGQTPPCILGKGQLPRSGVRATVTHWSQAGP